LVTIIGKIKDNQILLSIKDNGTGISSEIFPKLFTKYASKSTKGTGLGLYISKSIIEAHGGKIWAKNNKNEMGATFSFSLPVIDN
jgi:two-component system sensor histidine kinase VicK